MAYKKEYPVLNESGAGSLEEYTKRQEDRIESGFNKLSGTNVDELKMRYIFFNEVTDMSGFVKFMHPGTFPIKLYVGTIIRILYAEDRGSSGTVLGRVSVGNDFSNDNGYFVRVFDNDTNKPIIQKRIQGYAVVFFK